MHNDNIDMMSINATGSGIASYNTNISSHEIKKAMPHFSWCVGLHNTYIHLYVKFTGFWGVSRFKGIFRC